MMQLIKNIIFHALAIASMATWGMIMLGQGEALAASLTVYGPGGPYQAIRKCADLFGAKQGLAVNVRSGEPAKQAEQAAKDGDIYYSGAEYMMDDFIRDHPGILEESAIIYPATRRVGIIVRQGNPRAIARLADLAASGLRILDVGLECMGGLRGAANANVAVSVTTGAEGLATWKTNKDLDAWVTYKTWAEQLKPDGGEFIPIDGPQGTRRIPVTVMRNAPHPDQARAFLDFLQSEAARTVFLEHGYEPY